MFTGGVAGGVGGSTGDEGFMEVKVFGDGVDAALDIFFFKFLDWVGVGGIGEEDFEADGVLGDEEDLLNPDPFSMYCLA